MTKKNGGYINPPLCPPRFIHLMPFFSLVGQRLALAARLLQRPHQFTTSAAKMCLPVTGSTTADAGPTPDLVIVPPGYHVPRVDYYNHITGQRECCPGGAEILNYDYIEEIGTCECRVCLKAFAIMYRERRRERKREREREGQPESSSSDDDDDHPSDDQHPQR